MSGSPVEVQGQTVSQVTSKKQVASQANILDNSYWTVCVQTQFLYLNELKQAFTKYNETIYCTDQVHVCKQFITCRSSFKGEDFFLLCYLY